MMLWHTVRIILRGPPPIHESSLCQLILRSSSHSQKELAVFPSSNSSGVAQGFFQRKLCTWKSSNKLPILGHCSNLRQRYVNPIALKAITWKYFAVYVAWIAAETLCVYFLYPETHGLTLEELSFCKYLSQKEAPRHITNCANSVWRQIAGW